MQREPVWAGLLGGLANFLLARQQGKLAQRDRKREEARQTVQDDLHRQMVMSQIEASKAAMAHNTTVDTQALEDRKRAEQDRLHAPYMQALDRFGQMYPETSPQMLADTARAIDSGDQQPFRNFHPSPYDVKGFGLQTPGSPLPVQVAGFTAPGNLGRSAIEIKDAAMRAEQAAKLANDLELQRNQGGINAGLAKDQARYAQSLHEFDNNAAAKLEDAKRAAAIPGLMSDLYRDLLGKGADESVAKDYARDWFSPQMQPPTGAHSGGFAPKLNPGGEMTDWLRSRKMNSPLAPQQQMPLFPHGTIPQADIAYKRGQAAHASILPLVDSLKLKYAGETLDEKRLHNRTMEGIGLQGNQIAAGKSLAATRKLSAAERARKLATVENEIFKTQTALNSATRESQKPGIQRLLDEKKAYRRELMGLPQWIEIQAAKGIPRERSIALWEEKYPGK